MDMVAQIDELDVSLAEGALSLVIAALALGPARLTGSGRGMSSCRIWFPVPTDFDNFTAAFFTRDTLNAQASVFPPSDDKKLALIVVDSATAHARSELESWLIPDTGKLFVWDNVMELYKKTEPWTIAYALNAALKLRNSTHPSKLEIIRSLDLVKSLPVAAPELPLFQSGKAYIILGGVSDLGVHMSLWMYKVSSLFMFCDFL